MIPLPEIGDKFDAFTVQYGNKHRCGPFTRIKAQPPRKGALGPTKRHVIHGRDSIGKQVQKDDDVWTFYYDGEINWCFTFETIDPLSDGRSQGD